MQVNYQGKWWPAEIMAVEAGDRYKIHYDGYGANWDETVGTDRLKPR